MSNIKFPMSNVKVTTTGSPAASGLRSKLSGTGRKMMSSYI
jgi:hypothetical protein